MQPPNYDSKLDAAVNYGSLGSIIGHELAQGAPFSKHGVELGAWPRVALVSCPVSFALFLQRLKSALRWSRETGRCGLEGELHPYRHVLVLGVIFAVVRDKARVGKGVPQA